MIITWYQSDAELNDLDDDQETTQLALDQLDQMMQLDNIRAAIVRASTNFFKSLRQEIPFRNFCFHFSDVCLCQPYAHPKEHKFYKFVKLEP